MTTATSHHGNSRQIALTLTARYASSWGSWEGVRELVQNWHDGIYDSVSQRGLSLISKYEVMFCEEKTDMFCQVLKACLVDSDTLKEVILGRLIYKKLGSKLYLINGCTELHKKILLLGYSGKSSNKEVIGQFGEGLKVGALALVRNGHLVTMETSKDRWMFDLIHNEEFGEKVLTVVVTERCDDESDELAEQNKYVVQASDTCTTITGVNDWNTYLPRFLFLQPPKESVKTQLGSLLLDKTLSGQLYVKGLWVSDLTDQDLAAGVNFTTLQLDRDRNAIPKPSEIDHMMSGIWLQAIKKKPELINRYFNLLKSERYKDIRHAAEYMTDDLAKKIAFEFLNEFGKNAFPMLNSSSADQIASVSEELHLKTILCTQTMHEILIKSGCYRSLESALEENRVRQRTPVAFFSLTQTEIDTLESAVDLARLVDPSLDVSILDIIETNQSETCSSEDSRISVPRWYLDKETVHKRGALCRLSPGDCKCCEVMLCSALLYLSKQEMVNSPLMYLIQELVTKSHRRESQGTELPTEGSHPSLHNQGSHPSLHNQGSHLSAHNQGSHLSAHNQGSHPSLHNQVFIARESKLQEKIQQLEESLTNERQKVLKVMTKLKETEEQLTLREISVIDEETRIRENYKSEIEQWKKTSQVKFEDLLAKKDKLIMNLEATVSFKEKMLSRTQIQLEEAEAATEKKVGCLVDELTHYIAQNRNRTKSLSKLCAEQYQSTEEEESRGKWQLLQELCDTVLTELQEEKVLCSVCRWSRKNTMIQPCGHYCLCEKCAETLMSNQQDCPVCRSPIHRCLKVFET